MSSQAKNDIEKLIVKAQSEEIDNETFMNKLLESQFFMPVHEEYELGGLQTGNQVKPLTIKDKSGVEVLILFTSPDRAKAFIKDFPGYNGGFLAEFKWIIEKVGAGYAISINPTHDLGIDLEAVMLEQLTAH